MGKKYVFIITGLIAILLIVLLFSLHSEKGTYGIQNNTVSVTCPRNGHAGQNIECSVKLSETNTTIISINANYSMPPQLEYVSFNFTNECNGDSCVAEATQNGFAYGMLSGITAGTEIGKLTIKISESAEENTSYQIGFYNIELSNGDFQIINADNLTVNVQVVSDNSDNSENNNSGSDNSGNNNSGNNNSGSDNSGTNNPGSDNSAGDNNANYNPQTGGILPWMFVIFTIVSIITSIFLYNGYKSKGVE
ncbi:MAG: hypothetical protein IKI04_03420 [Bacilli bacterium]|nr:hypothetical protein [Bacilli bacterium]